MRVLIFSTAIFIVAFFQLTNSQTNSENVNDIKTSQTFNNVSNSTVINHINNTQIITNIYIINGTIESHWNPKEVEPLPLKNITDLAPCAPDVDEDKFICVPYHNCDKKSGKVVTAQKFDGSGIINVRVGDGPCEYSETCCQFEKNQTASEEPLGNRTSIPTPIENSCGVRNPNGVDIQINGKDGEAEFGEFPWMVAILKKHPQENENILVCGGSLIAPQVVLTAAHCVYNVKIEDIGIRAGEWDTQTENERIPYQERNVWKIILHEHFISMNLYNDVALLVLDTPLSKTETVGTICLPPPSSTTLITDECYATGWGKDLFGRKGKYAVFLKKVQLSLVDSPVCQEELRKTRLGEYFVLHKSFICAAGGVGRDTCEGDGGGPLVCADSRIPHRYHQVGIVAWGISCGQNIPAVYARVSLFRDWIDAKLQQLEISPDFYIE